jgi:hypothetical protein
MARLVWGVAYRPKGHGTLAETRAYLMTLGTYIAIKRWPGEKQSCTQPATTGDGHVLQGMRLLHCNGRRSAIGMKMGLRRIHGGFGGLPRAARNWRVFGLKA